MQDDPVKYWQDITANYRRMSDGQLLELAEKLEDLTEVARQALRDEISLRRLDQRPPRPRVPPAIGMLRKDLDGSAAPLEPLDTTPYDESGDEAEDEASHEFTWKTALCECGELIEALQLSTALRRAGIDNWIEAPKSYAIELGGPRVLVAADQLEEARAVAARPIPQDIIDDSKTEVPEFESPFCPKCRAADPILDSVEPVNSWLCEACGFEWTDPEEEALSEGRDQAPSA